MAAIPPSSTPVQQPGAQSTNPVSESLVFAIGATANYALINSGKVGDVIMSFLSVAAFQAQRDESWVLAMSMDVTGSLFATLTGLTTLPDIRGTFPRACDQGRGLDPNGEKNPGDYLADQVGPHTHVLDHVPAGSDPSLGTSFSQIPAESFTTPWGVSGEPQSPNGVESAPKTTYLNFFVKINT